MAITAEMRTQISQMYVALFGRAADSDGLGYWVSQLDSGKTLAQVAQDMYNTTPARAYYPLWFTDSEIVTAFYTNVLGRAPDADGLAYWAAQLATKTEGEVIRDMVVAVTNYAGTDAAALSSKALFNNRADVSEYYAVTARGAADGATAALDGVTADTATVTTAKTNIGTAAGTAGTGITVAFTTNGADNLSGTTANDIINAAVGTYNGGESVDGKAGTDTLTIRDNATTNGLSMVRNVEQINIIAQGTGAAVDFTDMLGFSSLDVWGNGMSASLNNLATSQLDSALVIGVKSGFGGDLTVGYQDLSGTNDTLRLKVGAASAFGIVESAQAFENLSITVDVATGANIGMGVNSGVYHGALSAVTLASTTAGNVTIKIDRNATATASLNVNASALAGNLTLTLGTNIGSALEGDLYSAGELIINAGTGNDVVILGGNSGGASGYASNGSAFSIDMGAGTDTLRVVGFQSAQLLPSAINFENLDILALDNGVAGSTAGINFSSTTASLSQVSIWGEASAFALVNMTAGATVRVVSGFTGNLTIGLASSTSTADSITIIANNASGFEFHETAQAIETINFQVNGTAYAGSASEFGTATTTFNIKGDQNVTMRLNANSANTALTISSTALTAGNLSLTIDAISGNQQLNITLGTGGDTLTLASGVFHNNMTSVFDGGVGTDSLSLVLETSGFLAPQVAGFETITVISDNSAVNFLGSSVTGATTLNVTLGSNAASAVTVSKLNSDVATINVGFWSSSSTGLASAALSFSYASAPTTLTVNLNANSTAVMPTAFLHSLDINSATVVTVAVNGTNNLQMGDLYADEATALTITMATGGVDFNMSALSAANAGSVTINAQGGDINIGTASFATATLITINQAGGTGSYSGSYIGNLSANRADLTINAAGAGNSAVTAGVIVSTAYLKDDLTITTTGGDVIVGELHFMNSAIASSVTGNLTLTLAANGSADYITIANISVGSGGTANTGAHNLVMNISGSGDVTIGSAILATGAASNNTANVINASGLFGTLVLGFSATQSANFTVNLGADQASANTIALGNGNDTVTGGGSKDTIEGGAGQDTLRGGGGSDVFVFLASAGNDNADHTLSAQSDFIMDFASGDVIWFSGITQLTSVAGATSLTGLGTTSAVNTATLVGVAVASAASLAIYQASGNTYVEVSLVSGAAADSGLVTIVLDGFAGWTSLSSVFNITVGASGLYIAHV